MATSAGGDVMSLAAGVCAAENAAATASDATAIHRTDEPNTRAGCNAIKDTNMGAGRA